MYLHAGYRHLAAVTLSLSLAGQGCSTERHAYGTFQDAGDSTLLDAGIAKDAGQRPGVDAQASDASGPEETPDAQGLDETPDAQYPDAQGSGAGGADASTDTGAAGTSDAALNPGADSAADGSSSTPDTCAPNPCGHDGTCTQVGSEFTCRCPAPWAGTTCELQMFTPLVGLTGGSMAYALGVDEAGELVAGYGDSPVGERAVIWRADGPGFSAPVTLGDLSGQARGVSADGKYVVGYALTGTGQHAMRWRASDGAVEDLVPTSTTSTAYAANRDGSVVVGVSDGRAFRWTANSIKYLGDGEALGVSAAGDVVVGGGSATAAFRWIADGETRSNIPGLELATNSRATAVSRDGSVAVGYSSGEDGSILAFRQAADRLAVTLGTRSYQAYASDESGALIGGNSPAWLWTTDAGVFELSSVLTDAGIDVSKWYLNSVTGIIQRGAVLIGDGQRVGGVFGETLPASEAWVVRLRPDQDL